jgi:hypothetical protein
MEPEVLRATKEISRLVTEEQMRSRNGRHTTKTRSRPHDGAKSSEGEAARSMLEAPKTNADREEHPRRRMITIWKISRETLRADRVKVKDAAAELGCSHVQAIATLTGGTVLENNTHFFSATLDAFIAMRNGQRRRLAERFRPA